MTVDWDTCALGAVAAINYGYTESASPEPIGPRFLRITDIQNDSVDWQAVPFCPILTVDIPKYRLMSGDIVFARTGATTGKSFLVNDPPEAIFASYLIRLRLLDKRLLPEFVSLFFQTAGYWKSIRDGSTGSAQGGFNASKLATLCIPVPPLLAQRRIVAVVKEAFDGIAASVTNTEKNLANARELFEGYLNSAFNKRAERWVEKRLDQIGRLQTGTTPKTSEIGNTGNHIPFIKPGDFNKDGSLNYDNEGLSEMGLKSSRLILPGSALMVCIGATIGKAAYAERAISANQQVNAITPVSGMLGRFIYYQMITDRFQEKVMSGSSQATLPIINKSKWGALEIRFPSSIEEQLRIVSILDDLSLATAGLQDVYKQKLGLLAGLKQPILQRAFSGELTAQPDRSLQEALV